MATVGFSTTWAWLFLLGTGALQLGGAPLPLDPVLSSVAPEECLWYASYAGQGPADPKSSNQTEQLFAEPQVRRFADEIEAQLLKGLRRAAGPAREKRVLAEQGPKLLRALLTRPSAVLVEEMAPRDGGGVDAEAALIVNVGDQQADVQIAIQELLQLAPHDRPFEVEQLDSVEWRRVPTPPEGPAVRFGWKDAYFLIAIGDNMPSRLIERMGGTAPQWLSELRSKHPIERELSLAYLNVAGILERIRPVIEQEEKAWPMVEALGLTHITAVHSVTGYDDVACKALAHVVTDGEHVGLLGLLPHEPLEQGDLQPIPKDALFAAAAHVDLGEVLNQGLALAGELNPRGRDNADRALWELETKLGINVRDDLLASLGDAWTVHVPAGELTLSWLNATVAVRVKDADALRSAVEKLVDAAQAEMGRHARSGSIAESKLGEHVLYTFLLPEPAPISPSWCVGDDWLVASLSPLAVRTALEQAPGDSLAAAPPVAEALAGEGGVAALAYQDTPSLVKGLYPWMQMGLQMGAGGLRRHGIELDPTILPSREVIVKHLRPGIATLRHAQDGFHFTSRQSMPGGGNWAAAGPVGAALLLPAVGSARHAARSSQSMNNMKQIVLALHMYHDTYKQFPSDILDKEGKPILSWRVRLLPFMEQHALYKELKLDEPWDSEHNRRFTSTVIPTFVSPTSPDGDKTRYLALKGAGGVFDASEGLKFKQITDGLSNTIAFVEAAPEQATPWAKPADIDFDADKPLEGVRAPDGSVLIAMCDGSVRRASPDLDAEVFKAMVTYAGGEAQ